MGGRQTLTLLAYFVRFNFYLDIWPAKFTYENYYSNELLSSRDNCIAGFTYLDWSRILLYFQMDYADCGYGIIGYFLKSTYTCEW